MNKAGYTQANTTKRGLRAWVQQLRTQDMPVVGNVIAELNAISGNDDADVNQMAEVILRDPNLTSQVLRIANSVQYNYAKKQVNTVSRAVVRIGLKGMRAICISLLLVDSLVKGDTKERLLKLIAQGFHAATQARFLIMTRDEDAAEEVFIAALLFNLGEMAFWSLEESAKANLELMSEDPKVRRAAMERELGTSFKAITRELAKHWHLGETLVHALYPPGGQVNAKVSAVITGERLARAALYGWDSPQVHKVLKEVMAYTSTDLETAAANVKACADQAAQVALDFGVSAACPHIPSSLADIHRQQHNRSKIIKGDVHLQLSILRELSAATRDSIDVNTIFQMTLEGMHRGIGLERVAVAVVKGHKLVAKYILGEHTEHWRAGFSIDIGPYSDNMFTHAMSATDSSALWIDSEVIDKNAEWYSPDIVRILGKLPAMIYAVKVGQRKVAAFYADRWTFGGKLDQERFESFTHFASQAQMSLNLLSPDARLS